MGKCEGIENVSSSCFLYLQYCPNETNNSCPVTVLEYSVSLNILAVARIRFNISISEIERIPPKDCSKIYCKTISK